MLLKVDYPHFDVSYQHVMRFFRVDYVLPLKGIILLRMDIPPK